METTETVTEVGERGELPVGRRRKGEVVLERTGGRGQGCRGRRGWRKGATRGSPVLGASCHRLLLHKRTNGLVVLEVDYLWSDPSSATH